MLGTNQVVAALAGLCIPELAPLSLADRVPGQDNISTLHKALAQRLIMVLAVWGMSSRHENGRIFFALARLAFIRQIDESSHIDSRKAFKNHLINVKAVH